MIFDKTEENKNSRKKVETCISYHEDFVELRKKIILKEKEIIEKRKNNLKEGDNQKNQFLYRSFDEFYKYRKNYEEYENKIKNEALKLLNKSSHKYGAFNEEKIKSEEKYSYIKFKTERQGTVKQLKEYFQKMQEEKIQKRNNSLYTKNNLKYTISMKPKDNKEEVKKKKKTVLEKNENEKKEYIVENKEKDQITELHNINNTHLSRNESTKNTINKDKDEQETKEFNKRIENINTKEIELLYNLINEMKNSYESDEDYISNLIEELHNSNKRYMIDKILDLLKIFDDKITSNIVNKNEKGSNSFLEKNEQTINKINHHKELKEMKGILEKKKLHNEEDKLNKEYIDEKEYSIKDKEQYEKINHMKIEKMELHDINKNNEKKMENKTEKYEREKNEKSLNNSNISSNDIEKENTKENNICEDMLNNKYKNESFHILIDKRENDVDTINKSNVGVSTKNENSNKKNIINDNKIEKDTNYASKFEWFYSTMNDIYEEDINGYEENSNLDEELKDYSSDDSEKNNMFLWLKNRDVENILNEKNKINEKDVMTE